MISAEFLLKNGFVEEPRNGSEENWFSDMSPGDSRGVIKSCLNCDSVQHRKRSWYFEKKKEKC